MIRIPYLPADWSEFAAALSPNARWVAYVTDETGRPEVNVRSFPDPTQRFKITNGGGLEPVWAADGKTLYYREGSDIVAARVNTNGAFHVLSRDTLHTELGYRGGYQRAQYDVDPNGNGFVMVTSTDNQGLPAELTVVVNWFTELRRRMTGAPNRP